MVVPLLGLATSHNDSRRLLAFKRFIQLVFLALLLTALMSFAVCFAGIAGAFGEDGDRKGVFPRKNELGMPRPNRCSQFIEASSPKSEGRSLARFQGQNGDCPEGMLKVNLPRLGASDRGQAAVE